MEKLRKFNRHISGQTTEFISSVNEQADAIASELQQMGLDVSHGFQHIVGEIQCLTSQLLKCLDDSRATRKCVMEMLK